MGVIGAVAAASPLGLTGSAGAALGPARLSRRLFQPRVGSKFRLVAGGSTYTAVLRPIRDLPNSAAGHQYRFSLLFTTDRTGPPQGTHRFYHPSLGTMSLFVVPVGAGGRSYEAVVFS